MSGSGSTGGSGFFSNARNNNAMEMKYSSPHVRRSLMKSLDVDTRQQCPDSSSALFMGSSSSPAAAGNGVVDNNRNASYFVYCDRCAAPLDEDTRERASSSSSSMR